MKSAYLKKVTILTVTITVVAASIYLFWPKDTELAEITQPVQIPQAQDQSVQVTN